jgi:hypothetical protein
MKSKSPALPERVGNAGLLFDFFETVSLK